MKKYKFFWKGQLCNWSKTPFTITLPNKQIITFENGEQYMMYMKAILFKDSITANKILDAKDPKTHKALGREVKNFDSKVWDEQKEDIVYRGLYFRTIQNPALLKEVLESNCDLFVEASPFDTIWGIGLEAHEAKNISEDEWPGQNLLGKLFTELRDNLKEELNIEKWN